MTESTVLNDNIVIQSGDIKSTVATMSALLSDDKTNIILNFNVLDLAILESNQTQVQEQLNDFKNNINAKLKDLGYLITI